MKSSVEWKTYRTRFLVKAKQLNSSLSFIDHLGRQHCGRRGDYLVESCDGVLSIAPRQIFEDIYVAMSSVPQPSNGNGHGIDKPTLKEFCFEPLRIEKIKPSFHDNGHERTATLDRASRPRKSPQTVRVSPTRVSLM